MIYLWCVLFICSCNESVKITESRDEIPAIFPDYTDIVIPPNIAPLNFMLEKDIDRAQAVISWENGQEVFKQKNGQFTFPSTQWKKILASNKGKSIQFTIQTKEGGRWISYRPFTILVAQEPVDPFLAYRLIEPGHEMWSRMGLYQRNLENFKQRPIIENKMTGGNCMNCHSFPGHNAEKMLFHFRGNNSGTFLVNGNQIEKFDTKSNGLISALVYPHWHPSEKYIAFSVNQTLQSSHANDPNTVEVYDLQSDVVVFDVEKEESFTSPLLFSDAAFESFPAFSADGETLFYCSADTVDMPAHFNHVQYSICSLPFDPVARRFGTKTDTLFHARTDNASAAFPRPSPDGRFLLYTQSSYGGFHIWHKDADLHIIDLQTGNNHALANANSTDSEGYHCWSSNSRWIAFASRRMDGLYSMIYLTHIDPEGNCSKAFVIPQKKAGFYKTFNKSFNVPELTTNEVKINSFSIARKAKGKADKQIPFRQ